MSTKYMKRCSTSLLLREMQIKTTMRHHHTLLRMAVIKKLKIVNVGEDMEKFEHLHTVVKWCNHYGK